MRTIVQKAVIKVIKPQVVRFNCDFCGAVCGTRQNPKSTWTRGGALDMHFCKRAGCANKYFEQRARERQDNRIRTWTN